MGIVWGLISTVIGVVVWWLGRRVAANQQRIAELEARIEDLSKADHVLDRAHERAGDGRARHLKLLGLIPALWMIDQVTRRPAITAAAIAATMMASGVTINTARLPMVGDKVPGVAAPAAGETPTSELETRGSIAATDTTTTIPPPPPSVPVPESPPPTESTVSPRGTTTTTTTAPVPGSTTTTLEIVIDPPPGPGELLPSCLVEAEAPGLLKLCAG